MSTNSESVSGSFPSSFPSPGAKTRVRNKERSVSAREPWAIREEWFELGLYQHLHLSQRGSP